MIQGWHGPQNSQEFRLLLTVSLSNGFSSSSPQEGEGTKEKENDDIEGRCLEVAT